MKVKTEINNDISVHISSAVVYEALEDMEEDELEEVIGIAKANIKFLHKKEKEVSK